ncbi:MAG: hypothetical protein JWO95_1995 [Verrucomicrobiales bacterium]|nr:hypothetical protein [Verrucomicrobiales bacterium]
MKLSGAFDCCIFRRSPMRMKLLTFAVAICLCTTFVTRGDDTPAMQKDLATLQGEWTMVSGSADGQEMPAQMRQQMRRVCKGNETTTTMSGQIFIQAKFTLDPEKSPKTIDYLMTGGFTKGQKQLGIYELHGDSFKACFAKPGAERPKDFKGGEGITLSVWTRSKSENVSPHQNRP